MCGGVNATRIAPLILACVVALAVASTVGLVLWSSDFQQIDAVAMKGVFDVHRFAEATAKDTRLFGDPVIDPKPN